MNFSTFLELFEKTQAISWRKLGKAWYGQFEVEDRLYNITITENGWVSFEQAGGGDFGYDKAGMGIALRVLATVMGGVEEYIREIQPDQMSIIGANDIRGRIYQRLVAPMTATLDQLGYEIQPERDGFYIVKQGRAAAFNPTASIYSLI